MEEEIELKRELCNWLIKNNKVVPYQVIRHSYSTNRLNELRKENFIDVCPTLDTRCDCLGVVVYEDS